MTTIAFTMMMRKRIIPLCTLSALIAAPMRGNLDGSHLIQSTTTRLRRRHIRSRFESRRRDLDATPPSIHTHYNVFASRGTQLDLLDNVDRGEEDQAAIEVTTRQFTGSSDVCELNSGGLYGRPNTIASVYEIQYLYQIYVTGGTSQAILLSLVAPDLDKVITEGILPAFFDCAPISNRRRRRRDRLLQAINGRIDAVSSRPPDQIAFGDVLCRGNRFPGTDCYIVEGALSVFARGFDTQQQVENVVLPEIQKVVQGNALSDNIPQVKVTSNLNDDLTIAEPIPSPTASPTSPAVPIIPTTAPAPPSVQPAPTIPIIIPTPVPVAPTPAIPPISTPTTQAPTRIPTLSPTRRPTKAPTTTVPTRAPTASPTNAPTVSPTNAPTASPTLLTPPTSSPVGQPTPPPVRLPTRPVPSRPGPDRPSLTLPPDIGGITASPVPMPTTSPTLNETTPAQPTIPSNTQTPVLVPTEPSAPILFTSSPTAAPTSSTALVEKQSNDNNGLAWWAWLLIIGSILGVFGGGYSFYRRKQQGNYNNDDKQKIGMSATKSDEFALVDNAARTRTNRQDNDGDDGGDVFSYVPPSSTAFANYITPSSPAQPVQDNSLQFTSPRFESEHAPATMSSTGFEDLDSSSSSNSNGSEEEYRREADESGKEGSYVIDEGNYGEEGEDYGDEGGDDFKGDEGEYDDDDDDDGEYDDDGDDDEGEYDDEEEEYDDDEEEYDEKEDEERYSDTDWEGSNMGWEEEDNYQESFGTVSFGDRDNSEYDESNPYILE